MLRPLCVRILSCVVFCFASFSFSLDFVFLLFTNERKTRERSSFSLICARFRTYSARSFFIALLFLFVLFSFYLTPLLHPSCTSCPVTSTLFFLSRFSNSPPAARQNLRVLALFLFILPFRVQRLRRSLSISRCWARFLYCICSPVSSLRTRCSRRRRRGLRYLTRFSTHVTRSLLFFFARSLFLVFVSLPPQRALARDLPRDSPLLRDIFRFPFRYVCPVSDT